MAQALSGRIHPNIGGNSFGRVPGPQNMIIEFLLPQTAARRVTEFTRGRQFKSPDEKEEVAPLIQPKDEHVKMVGHDAIGVNGEAAYRRLPTKCFDEMIGAARVHKNRAVSMATNGDEIPTTPDVVGLCKPDVLVSECHAIAHRGERLHHPVRGLLGQIL